MKFIKTEKDLNKFHFICEGCKCEGILSIGINDSDVSCPEGCGARYIQWRNPLTNQPDLMCIVCPIFDDDDMEDQK